MDETGSYSSARRSEVECLAVIDGSLITGHEDGFLRIPNLTTGDIRHTIAGHKAPVTSMCVVGSILYSASLKVRTCNLTLLFSSGVHAVQTFGTSKLEWMIDGHGPSFDYFTMRVLLAIDFLQLFGFGFKAATPWSMPPAVREQLQAFLTFGLPNVPYTTAFKVACSILIPILALVIAHEQIEWNRFSHPNSKPWKLLWLATKFLGKQLCKPLFLPLFSLLASAFDCNRETGLMEWGHFGSLQCWEGQHMPYAVASFVLLCVYVPCAVRVLRVGGDLEMLMPAWHQDLTAKQYQVYKHPFSFLNPSKYNVWAICAKMVLVFLTVVFTSWIWLVSMGMWCVGLSLLALTVQTAPFAKEESNQVRTMLDAGVLWIYTCQVLAVLFPSSPLVLWLLATCVWPALWIGYNMNRWVSQWTLGRHVMLKEDQDNPIKGQP